MSRLRVHFTSLEKRSIGMTRAVWKGQLVVGPHEIPIKLYAAIEDRKTHSHLLHDKDNAPVEQQIVCKDTGEKSRR
ncbi:MAG: hypothetical protein C0P74_000945 [Gammaproteobacteria bacterium]|nr:hypothetical protein [Gammaproteobacteria bacterium]